MVRDVRSNFALRTIKSLAPLALPEGRLRPSTQSRPGSPGPSGKLASAR